MAELTKDAEPAVRHLLLSEENQLFEELGIISKAVAIDPVKGATFAAPDIKYDGTQMGPLDELRKLGKRLFRVLNAAAYRLICGTDAQDEKAREDIANALGGEVSVAAVIAGLLVTQVGILPALAAVIAALVVKRFLRPTYEELCKAWKEKL